MSRSTTYRGLPQEAMDYIGQYGQFESLTFTDRYGKSQSIYRPVQEKIEGRKVGMFREFDLFKYKMKDGTWAEEFSQASPWASGPHEFIGLEHNGKKFLWPQKEIDKI